MTFQVGLIGKDDIVLASDLLHTSIDEITGFRSAHKARKIRIPNERFAYCCAGLLGGWADKSMEAFLGMKNAFTQEGLMLASQVAWKQASQRERENPFWKGSILLVEHGKGTNTLWHMNANCPPSPSKSSTRKHKVTTEMQHNFSCGNTSETVRRPRIS